MNSLLRITAVIGVPFSMVFGYKLAGGRIVLLLPIAEFIIIFGMTFFALFATYGKNVFILIMRGLIALFQKPVPNPEFVKIATVGCHYARASAVISLALGLINVLVICPIEMHIFSRHVACALCSITYGVILSEFFFGYLRNIFKE